jgi:hypothetical protein
MSNETYLDLRIVTLYGWEQYKSDKVILEIQDSILNGNDFNAVKVEMIDETTFQIAKEKLNNNRLDGGHHRAYAHYLANKKLKCIITKRIPQLTETIKIKDIILVPDNKIINEIYTTPAGKKIPIISLEENHKRNL